MDADYIQIAQGFKTVVPIHGLLRRGLLIAQLNSRREHSEKSSPCIAAIVSETMANGVPL
jgi:hypothetical protein